MEFLFSLKLAKSCEREWSFDFQFLFLSGEVERNDAELDPLEEKAPSDDEGVETEVARMQSESLGTGTLTRSDLGFTFQLCV